MKESHYIIKDWKSLEKLVENTNPFKETLILFGSINKFEEVNDIVTAKIDSLLFKKITIETLKELHKKNEECI